MPIKAVLAIVFLAAAAFAYPLEARSTPPLDSGSFAPTDLRVYDVSNGAIWAKSNIGMVVKSNGVHEKTTLMTFEFPEYTRNKKCALYFYSDPTISWSGSTSSSQKLAIFSTIQVATGKTSGWSPGNQRDKQLGVWKTSSSSPWADWEATYGELSVPQNCKPGETEGFEIVGQGDNAWLSFHKAVGGVRIAYW